MSYFDFTSFERAFHHHIKYVLGKKIEEASRLDLLNAVSAAVNKYLMDISFETKERYRQNDAKRLYYMSMEFLVGRLLSNNLINLGIYKPCARFLKKLGFDLEDLVDEEKDPALGNGGLGRLAACFLDSLASLDMPGFGYGINYDYGLFKQVIVNGYQQEKPDYWPNLSSPWLIRRSDACYMIPIYGKIEEMHDHTGDYDPKWINYKHIIGKRHDILVAGYGGRTVNQLRLFSARASEDFDIEIFNDGDYFNAVSRKIRSEAISKILYPSDSKDTGKELRLVQEYFLVACSVRDLVRIYKKTHDNFDQFHKKVAIQLNDTHPALTVAELMRILVDENELEWEKAWDITVKTLGYTNHTLLPEALETWPVSILQKVVPRHLQIIYEINRRFITAVSEKFGDKSQEIIPRMSIIQEGDEKKVRMANLAIVGSHSVNGVAKIHSELVKTKLVPEFYSLWPEKFNNKTNGVTPRRWIVNCNPGLTDFICETIGDQWIKDLEQIWELEAFQDDPGFLEQLMKIKQENKNSLTDIIKATVSETVNPESIFDIHAKRIHEYKRQLLNIMNIIHLYLSVKEDNIDIGPPRAFIFSGKAAPGYHMAKLIIKLIHEIADVVNKDPLVSQVLKIIFLPDYRVTLAEKMIPAADISEQISTAGMEASGTGNMKFAMNGAVTLGTLDGANIEICEQVGKENIYIFGLTVQEVEQIRQSYNSKTFYDQDARLKRVMTAIRSQRFCRNEPGLFRSIYNSLMAHGDYYLHFADFNSYVTAHEAIGQDFNHKQEWAKKSLMNITRTGMFSSDRTIKEYAAEIWDIQPQIKNSERW
ncbi:MAG: glycogen/starch/alpha-glucan phosphorylase [Desulfobacula sp.]|jgi:glycogen phosphorylase|uniref:glycogen/starch/alpha-glucan phosphorylase n=1 Tax=Desulfobacula sp. TaxID=2593537 RepID=UPI001DCC7C9F|nr:glycogen/starch/alpha-glucan phosphorylase [Desulfobacula sp.]MBT3483895.1 glycogen/starch/alpha-glucan phosphorylase [Desulfobacula sp.]MBT3803084.1 glycogen/starch/alpha-glucan phosphorylase [Desulfobacula sp.]MBT4023404.1 glycogen/starch/alpha-glucan phosphorylase [Desulfobacula sp.]MBT4197132.1 glycogen/starch/alpha-glucan phosphorylase [Desulfobacula sp.]